MTHPGLPAAGLPAVKVTVTHRMSSEVFSQIAASGGGAKGTGKGKKTGKKSRLRRFYYVNKQRAPFFQRSYGLCSACDAGKWLDTVLPMLRW